MINAAWTTPLGLGRKRERRQERGGRVIGGEWIIEMESHYLKLSSDGVEISLSVYNLVSLPTVK
jgi:hypothetical protein